jgi:hypothetical protein
MYNGWFTIKRTCIPIMAFETTSNVMHICKHQCDLNSFICYVLTKFNTSRCIYSHGTNYRRKVVEMCKCNTKWFVLACEAAINSTPIFQSVTPPPSQKVTLASSSRRGVKSRWCEQLPRRQSETGQTESIKNSEVVNRTQICKGSPTRPLCQKNQGTIETKQKSNTWVKGLLTGYCHLKNAISNLD